MGAAVHPVLCEPLCCRFSADTFCGRLSDRRDGAAASADALFLSGGAEREEHAEEQTF